ncbi:23539_t:CDS:10 [Entrophospora sp. SA101]|nr:23539_t:CDS:10 [Entrophospora sp. SA101]
MTQSSSLVLTDKVSGTSWNLPSPETGGKTSPPKPTGVIVLPRNPNTQSLRVLDNRTNKIYEVPIENNTIPALKFKERTADPIPNSREEDESSKGLRNDYINLNIFVCLNSVYDPAVAKSKITYINGDAGILRYRGYPIEQLAEKSTYLEVAYLLIYGELPTKQQFTNLIMNCFYDTFPDANPALAGSDLFIRDEKARNKQILRLLGKTPTLAAMAYLHRIGRQYNVTQNNLSYTENFLYMLDHLSEENYKPNPKLARALDVLFILHADHELNCSTAAMRHIGSSLVDPYSAISGASTALYGPLHGGANEAVLRMLEEIGSKENVLGFLEEVKQRKRKLFGFGHRVYKNYDPRTKIIRKIAFEAALVDDYFVERKLYPNVDFYSGLIYKAMGFPTDMFPVLFAIPRVAGWLAHWKELLEDKETKIWRPRQVYVGPSVRSYIPLDSRERVHNDGIEVAHQFSKRSQVAEYDNKAETMIFSKL